MPPNTDDSDLRARFTALREEDAGQAPAFDAVWDEAVARAGRQPRRVVWTRYAAAAVLLVGLACTAIFLLQPRPAMSITKWQSPTAGLLQLSTPALDTGALPTSALLAPPTPHLEHYVPQTQIFWPGATLQPDTTN